MLENCVLAENVATAVRSTSLQTVLARGAGLYFAGKGELIARNTIFSCNTNRGTEATFGGSGLYLSSQSATIVNCTIFRNSDHGLQRADGEVQVMNSIVHRNGAAQISGDVTVDYSDVQDGFEGTDNIDFDPVFTDIGCDEASLTIVPGSPCIDTGNPDPAFNDACRPPALGTERNDMGAHGGPGNCGVRRDAPEFLRGDVDASGDLALTDAVGLLGFLFLGDEAPPCRDAADSDDNGTLSITDAILVLDFLFLGGGPPVSPGPFTCGTDPSADDLTCLSFDGCVE